MPASTTIRRRRKFPGGNRDMPEPEPTRETKRRTLRPELPKKLGLLDRETAGRLLGIDPSTAWRYSVEGLPTADGGRLFLRARRFGRALYFHPDDLDAFSLAAAEALRKTPDHLESTR